MSNEELSKLLESYKKELREARDVYKAAYIKGCYYKYALQKFLKEFNDSTSDAFDMYEAIVAIASIEDTPYGKVAQQDNTDSSFIPGED